MEAVAIATWSFYREAPIPHDIGPLLVHGEQPHVAFTTFRDTAIFTNKRLIVRDAQGITGKKVEVYSLPYTSIHMWSTENVGTLDFNADIDLWTRTGKIKIKVGPQLNVRALDRLIGHYVLAV